MSKSLAIRLLTIATLLTTTTTATGHAQDASAASRWPSVSGYIQGSELLASGGLSSVTVDNSSNSSAAHVKLFRIGAGGDMSVREFYLSAYGKFTLTDVAAGTYDIRYRDLESNQLAKSEPFELEEVATSAGTSYSVLEMTLYKVSNGNMETYPLSEDEFN